MDMRDVATQPEGSDITAADMIPPPEIPSEILEFFSGSTVFLTGATGFLGRMFLEKLLRTCDDIKRIYVLIRPKKGKDVEKRFDEIFDGPSFEPLKRKNPNYAEKVTLMGGDCALTDLGLDESNKSQIIADVDVILHCAATVRFDEKLRTAVNINIRSVRDLIKIAKQMKHLRAMVHVSTAFSNCIHKQIDETFYDPPITGDKLLTLIDCLSDDKLDAITPTLLGDFPNTYVFTKAIAENVIKETGQNLPIALYRPSIVIASVNEPVAGWIDNYYGATGVLMGAALGLLRSLHGKKTNMAEMVPADYAVNAALAAAWDVASIKSLNDNKETNEKQSSREEKFEKEIPVYNFVSSPEKPITWEEYMALAEKYCVQIPSPLLVWHYFFAIRSNKYAHTLALFFYHTIPAYLIDFLAICLRKEPMLVKGYKKINKFEKVISYFSMREWHFKNNNIQALWKRMNSHDRRIFEFTMKNFNWDSYFYTYARGSRVYLLKDPLDTIPQGYVRYYKLMVAHYVLVTFLFALLYYLLSMVYRFLF